MPSCRPLPAPLPQPLPGDPGWRVLVDPSPVLAIAEVYDGSVTGVTMVARPGQDTGGGALIMVPGSLRLADGRRLEELAPGRAMEALAAELRLGFVETYVVTPLDWPTVLGDKVYFVDNPDPILAADGSLAIPVGRFDVDANAAAGFLGAPADGGSLLSLLFRRELFWQEVLADPPVTSDPVALLMQQVAADSFRIDDLPTETVGDAIVLDSEGAEALIRRRWCPFRVASAPGRRVVIRIVDRTGEHDARAWRSCSALAGSRSSEIANAAVFDDGPTQLRRAEPRRHRSDARTGGRLGADTVSPTQSVKPKSARCVLLVGFRHRSRHLIVAAAPRCELRLRPVFSESAKVHVSAAQQDEEVRSWVTAAMDGADDKLASAPRPSSLAT